ncbi:hypothetical protein Tco_1371362, partial [Tanacetum coccineum]
MAFDSVNWSFLLDIMSQMGLKINLLKSRLFGIGVSEEEVVNIARAVNCSNDSLPSSYLGLPIGRYLNKINAWYDIVYKFTKRPSSWKANLLSIGGRLTLVKSVLATLPLYFLSLFKAPQAVISHLEFIRRRFFWGMEEDENKMAWNRQPSGRSDGEVSSLLNLLDAVVVRDFYKKFYNSL